MTPSQFESLGLLAAPEPVVSPTVIDFRPRRTYQDQFRERRWPDYDYYLRKARTKQDGSGPDHSDADFYWCRKAARRRWNVEETAQKLLEVSEKAQERGNDGDKGYASVTARNAAEAAAKGWQRDRG